MSDHTFEEADEMVKLKRVQLKFNKQFKLFFVTHTTKGENCYVL